MKKKILAISGSVRKNSINTAILQYIKKAFKADLVVEIYDQVEQLPIFNPDLTDDLQARITQADGVLISTQNMFLACWLMF